MNAITIADRNNGRNGMRTLGMVALSLASVQHTRNSESERCDFRPEHLPSVRAHEIAPLHRPHLGRKWAKARVLETFPRLQPRLLPDDAFPPHGLLIAVAIGN